MRLITQLWLVVVLFGTSAWAEGQYVRWTYKDDTNADLAHVLAIIKNKTGYELDASQLLLLEDRDLAKNHFRMWAQMSQGVPLKGKVIRIWTGLNSGAAIQVEAHVENPAVNKVIETNLESSGFRMSSLSSARLSQRLTAAARARIRQNTDDTLIQSLDSRDYWDNGKLIRVFEARGRRGTHQVTVSVFLRTVVDYQYIPFATLDTHPEAGGDELTVPAMVFPIYEETDSHKMQERVAAQLKYIKRQARRTSGDPYAVLRTQRYTDDKMDPLLGETEAGRKQGYWSMPYIRRVAAQIRDAQPMSPNDFWTKLGVVLEGRYATVSLHPAVKDKFTGLNFKPALSAQFKPEWKAVAGSDTWEMIPMGSLLGRPLVDVADAWTRRARRLPDHNTVEYINDGFDEIQVYYSINSFMDSLRHGGFTDPELSTRPFNAFLYDPDIEMRDNAYYTDDTINFTTYSAKAVNYARDNPTIWHELGHGIMDRMMGDFITLADTGGLSEGMADFLAALVVADVTENKPFDGWRDFRIINRTAFFTTNEVHDDGEAYGGAMKDLLDAAIAKWSLAGIYKVMDLTLEAMRLARNHPALTAQDWFGRMLFADEFTVPGVRLAGELGPLIRTALAGRNFSLEGKAPASFTLKNGDVEVLSKGPGSRGSPIRLDLKASEKASYRLNVQLKNTETYQFKFPATVKVFLRSGPLQGAIRWDGEEKEPLTATVNSEADLVPLDISVSGQCDQINREDGSCVDYAYVQIWNNGETEKPQAKKRFYLRIKTKP